MNVGKIGRYKLPTNEQDRVPKNQKQKDWKQFMIARIIIDSEEWGVWKLFFRIPMDSIFFALAFIF